MANKRKDVKNESVKRKNKLLFYISAFCSVLFLILLILTPSFANVIGLAACLICALRLYSEMK